MPTLLSEAEGYMEHGANRQSCSDPARSKTLRMSGSLLHRSWEISFVPGPFDGRGRQGSSPQSCRQCG